MGRSVIAAVALLASPLVLPACGGEDDPDVSNMKVRAASGAAYDLAGTTWVRCHPDEPATGQSRRTVDVYGAGTGQHTEDVYTERTDCTGATDPGAHSTVSASFRVGPDRTVAWNGTPPSGLATEPVASGVEIAFEGGGFKTLAFVDDTGTPHRLYGGNENGAHDADGYPVQLEGNPALKQ